MANELASILARRRAKDGGENAAPVTSVDPSTSSAPVTAPVVTTSSISERIARLKQQSAAANAAASVPAAPRFNHPVPSSKPVDQLQSSSSSVGSISNASGSSAASESIDTSAVAAAQEAAGIRKASSKILQLQGSLGINVSPFGRPKEPSSGNRSGQRESIMSTGEEQYGNTQHAMGVAMPGLTGSAIPMPGLVKGGFRLPGTTAGGEQSTEASASLDDSHTTINRVAGPNRRGPVRPPPGAFRLPTMGAPILDKVEPVQLPASDSAVATKVSPADVVELKIQEASVQGSPASAVAASLHNLPDPEAIPPMRPYQIQDDDPYAPKYDDISVQNSEGPAGFPSALLANFSINELTIDDKPILKPGATSTSTPMHFGTPAQKTELIPQHLSAPATTMVSPDPVSAHAVAPASTPASEEFPATPIPASAPVKVPARVPVPMVSSPSPVPTAVVSTPALTPAPAPPTTTIDLPEPAPTTSSKRLGGIADDDDSSESDWSDADDDGASQTLFGAQDAALKSTAAAASALFTPSQPTPELCQATSLFGGSSSTPAPSVSSAHGFVQATPPTAIPPAPYSSLFGGAKSSSSESDSDSDDASGLFGK